jgi:hypothetical protein
LLGPGDLLRPWDYDGHDWLLPVASDWRVLTRTRTAALDRPWVHRTAPYPAIATRLAGAPPDHSWQAAA